MWFNNGYMFFCCIGNVNLLEECPKHNACCFQRNMIYLRGAVVLLFHLLPICWRLTVLVLVVVFLGERILVVFECQCAKLLGVGIDVLPLMWKGINGSRMPLTRYWGLVVSSP